MWFEITPAFGSGARLLLNGSTAPLSRGCRRYSDNQQTFNTCVFAAVHDDAATQVALLLLRFCACDVTQPGAVALYFPCASHLETLLGAGMGFHFRHDKNMCVKKWSAKVTPLPKAQKKSSKLLKSHG